MAYPEGVAGMFRIDYTYVYQSINCENVFFYWESSGAGIAADLSDAFGSVVNPAIMAVVSDTISSASWITTNLGSETDFFTEADELGGQRNGSLSKAFTTWNFSLATRNRIVPWGFKRFSGCCEDDIANNGGPESGIVSALTTLADVLALELVAAGNYDPVVISPANTRHDDDRFVLIQEGFFKKIGHQTSRD